MRHAISPTSLAPSFQHCDGNEYRSFLAGLPVTPSFRRMLLRYQCNFVERWPRIEDWFNAPCQERVGRLRGETQKAPSYPTSYRARSYLFYLALTGRVRLDYDWLLAIGDLCVSPIANALNIDLGIQELATEGVRHGYRPSSVGASMSWVVSRIALHVGIRSAEEVRQDHIIELLDAIERFEERHDISSFRASEIAERKRCWRINTRQLQLLLYHRGQVTAFPVMPSKRRESPPSDRPIMQAAIDRWIDIRRLTLSSATVDHQVVSLRHFMTHLASSAPDVRSFADLTRNQALSFVAAMAEDARSQTGRSLSIFARRARIAAIVMFFRDAIAWSWPDMPRRPLLDHRDMPRTPRRIPRYIPADELARLMAGIADLPCPYQRAALLVARWSGARRGEICRLAVDCLDAYPDGTPRLRLPAGKTLKERMVPLHEEAAAL